MEYKTEYQLFIWNHTNSIVFLILPYRGFILALYVTFLLFISW